MKQTVEIEMPTETSGLEECKQLLINLRNAALDAGQMEYAVGLSHCIAWLSAMQTSGVGQNREV